MQLGLHIRDIIEVTPIYVFYTTHKISSFLSKYIKSFFFSKDARTVSEFIPLQISTAALIAV
jgi:hypothetical protein